MFLSIWKYIKIDNYIDNIYFMYLYVSIYHFKFVCVCVCVYILYTCILNIYIHTVYIFKYINFDINRFYSK